MKITSSPQLKFSIIVCLMAVSCNEPIVVDTIIHNGIVHTMDEQRSKAEAIAIQDGKIIEVGPENQILNKYTALQKIDANKHFIYPGFIDAHSHFYEYGATRSQVDLKGTKSWDDVLDRLIDFSERDSSEWLMGRGWDQNDWKQKEFPTNIALDSLFPDRKIVLKRVDGHALIASTNVLKTAGISILTNVPGGQIIIDDLGQTTGVLIDEAMELVSKIIPKPSNKKKASFLARAEKECIAKGLTSVCDAGLSVSEVNLIDSLQRVKALKIGVYAMYSADSEILNNLSNLGIQTERLRAKAIKVYADGALGSRGARFLNPYSDDSSNHGLMITSKDSIMKWAIACARDSFQLCVHCIGTEANRQTLDAMGQVLGGTNDRRWRIEHAQVVHPDDREKFGRYNILPSMQPTHATSDMYWAERRIGGNRIQWAYSLRSLKNQNGMIPLGTDFPVEAIDPLNTFYAATARKDADRFPESGFIIDESLSREEALKGMTIWAAIANFEDELKGSIQAGKFADLVILDQDLLTCEEDNILSTKVLETWIHGERVYQK